MKKPVYPKGVIIWLIVWAVVLLLIYGAYLCGVFAGEEYERLKTCDWCGEKIYEEGTQLGEYWLHDLCFSQLNEYAGYWFKDEYTNDRMDWIKGLIEERKCQ